MGFTGSGTPITTKDDNSKETELGFLLQYGNYRKFVYNPIIDIPVFWKRPHRDRCSTAS